MASNTIQVLGLQACPAMPGPVTLSYLKTYFLEINWMPLIVIYFATLKLEPRPSMDTENG